MWVSRCGMSTIRISWWDCMSTTATRPASSQLNTATLPSGVKSPWSSPWQSGYCTRSTSCQVTGSYQIRLRRSSATEIAYLPSGVKYMLYGSATGSRCRHHRSRRARSCHATARLLHVLADRELVDHLEGQLIDHPHVPGLGVRHIRIRFRLLRDRAEHVRARRGVDVVRVDQGRHSGQHIDHRRR